MAAHCTRATSGLASNSTFGCVLPIAPAKQNAGCGLSGLLVPFQGASNQAAPEDCRNDWRCGTQRSSEPSFCWWFIASVSEVLIGRRLL